MSVPINTAQQPPVIGSFEHLRQLMTSGRRWRTRFAPAPTGFLHVGHIVNAMHVWGIARAFGGAVTVRIEDHDRTRSQPDFERAILEDLEWLGFVSDDDSSNALREKTSRYRQSDNDARYVEAMHRLDEQGLVFACRCTRRDIASIAGHRDNVETPYPGTCRHAGLLPSETPARRIRIDPGTESFDDMRLGQIDQEPSQQCGDLLLRDRHGNWTYQFAVVVDDITHGVDVVIRGEDLLASTGRQIRLARLLGRERAPRFYHHPLIRHPDGSKLSKSNRDTGIRELRASGLGPSQLLGVAAHAAGLTSDTRPIDLAAIAGLFATY
jgi:glutamyl-Q tRNA(Asp) synthetase